MGNFFIKNILVGFSIFFLSQSVFAEGPEILCQAIKADVGFSDLFQRYCSPPSKDTPQGLVVGLYYFRGNSEQNRKAKEVFQAAVPFAKILEMEASSLAGAKLADVVSELSAFTIDAKNRHAYTLGDSGTGPFFARWDLASGQKKRFHLRGVPNTDWEALVLDDRAGLWILDVGDNKARRKSVWMYRVRLQDLARENIVVSQKIEVKYQSGARDVEGAFFHDGQIHLIEKSYYGKVRVSVVNPDAPASGVATATDRWTWEGGEPITDAFLGDDLRVRALTYGGVVAYDLQAGSKPNQELRHVWGQVEAIAPFGPTWLIGREDGQVFIYDFKQKKHLTDLPKIQ